jgi:hypothetical protein
MHPGYLFLGFSLFVFSCLSNNPYQISENDTFPWLPMKPINKASEGAETPAIFAALYASNDPGVSAPDKPWIKLTVGRPATQL